jgi:hypothetical protein
VAAGPGGRPSRRGREISSGGGRARRGGNDADRGTEQRILALEEERDALERRIAAAFERGDYREGRRLSKDLERTQERIEELYERWGA